MTGGGVSTRLAIDVYARSTAVAATGVRQGKTYPLSPLDHAMAAHTVHLVFYYRSAATSSTSAEREQLKDSLSKALSYFPAMTGRLFRDEADGNNWAVRYNDAGVRLLDARAAPGVTLDEWFATATAEDEKQLARWEEPDLETEPESETEGGDRRGGGDKYPYSTWWSPYSVQVTEFDDKGYAIGLSCTHMHADPTTAVVFVRAWSDIHRRSCIAYPPFFHPPALRSRHSHHFPSHDHPPPPTSSAVALLSLKSSHHRHHQSSSPSSISTTFVFSDASVRSLLSGTADGTTPFAALAALFWSRIEAVSAASAGAPGGAGVGAPDGAPGGGSSSIIICTDFRKRLHAPLPHGFYGNAIHFSRVEADPAGGEEGRIAALAAAIDRGAWPEEEEYWSAIEWFEDRRRRACGTYPPAFRMYGPELTFVCLDHVFAFTAVFDIDGGRPPAHVSIRLGCGSDDGGGEGMVIVMPAAPEGGGGGSGRAVTVVLPPEKFAGIRHDHEILKLQPTILLGD